MREVRAAEVILHCRSRATGVDIYSASMSDSVIVVYRSEVDAVARYPAGVGDRLVQVGSGKQEEPSRRTNYFDRVGVDHLLGFWLLAGIRFDMLRGFNPISSIPLGIIIYL